MWSEGVGEAGTAGEGQDPTEQEHEGSPDKSLRVWGIPAMTAYGLRSHSGRVLRVGVEWAWGSAKGATSLHGGEEGKVSYLGVLGPVPIPVHKYVLRAHWVQGAGLRLAVAGLCPLLCWEAVSLLAGACPVAPTHSHPQPPPWLGKDHAASPALIVNVFFFFSSLWEHVLVCIVCIKVKRKSDSPNQFSLL